MKQKNSNNDNHIKVCIIDDREECRESLKKTLANDPRIRIYGEYDSGLRFIKELKSPFEPDVCLVDIKLKDKDISGIECCKRIKEKNPNIHIIIITSYPSSETLAEAQKIGADYIVKNTRGEIIIDKIVTNAKSSQGEQLISIPNDLDYSDIIRLARQMKLVKSHVTNLSKNQRKVLKLQKSGKSVHEIALILKMKPNTVRTHIERALNKLDLPNLLYYIEL